MILALHITIALLGVFLASIILIKPSRATLNYTKYSALFTLISGSILVISTGSSLIKACLSGLVYFGFVGLAVVYSNRKLNEV